MNVIVTFKDGLDYETDSLERAVDWIRDQINKDEYFCRKIGNISIENIPYGSSYFIEKREIDTDCGRKHVKVREDYSIYWRITANIDGEIKEIETRNLKGLNNVLKENPFDVHIEPLDGRAEEDLRDLLNAGLLKRDAYIDGVHVMLSV